MTGLLPDDLPATVELESPKAESSVASASDAAVANEVITHLLRHTRYLLTLKGRPPFRLAGIETYQRLQGVADLRLFLIHALLLYSLLDTSLEGWLDPSKSGAGDQR